eukprot:Nk52_evm1s1901 gene=Nk52_evmTU1s1901
MEPEDNKQSQDIRRRGGGGGGRGVVTVGVIVFVCVGVLMYGGVEGREEEEKEGSLKEEWLEHVGMLKGSRDPVGAASLLLYDLFRREMAQREELGELNGAIERAERDIEEMRGRLGGVEEEKKWLERDLRVLIEEEKEEEEKKKKEKEASKEEEGRGGGVQQLRRVVEGIRKNDMDEDTKVHLESFKNQIPNVGEGTQTQRGIEGDTKSLIMCPSRENPPEILAEVMEGEKESQTVMRGLEAEQLRSRHGTWLKFSTDLSVSLVEKSESELKLKFGGCANFHNPYCFQREGEENPISMAALINRDAFQCKGWIHIEKQEVELRPAIGQSAGSSPPLPDGLSGVHVGEDSVSLEWDPEYQYCVISPKGSSRELSLSNALTPIFYKHECEIGLLHNRGQQCDIGVLKSKGKCYFDSESGNPTVYMWNKFGYQCKAGNPLRYMKLPEYISDSPNEALKKAIVQQCVPGEELHWGKLELKNKI